VAKSQRGRGAVSNRVLELLAAKKPAKKTHTWEITLIRERGRLLGHVEALESLCAVQPCRAYDELNRHHEK
jgi:hypothetical protein